MGSAHRYETTPATQADRNIMCASMTSMISAYETTPATQADRNDTLVCQDVGSIVRNDPRDSSG